MIFHALELPDAWIIDLERHRDGSGFVATAWSATALHSLNLPETAGQCIVVHTSEAGTIRGMNVTRRLTRLVRCTRGAVYDVIVDLRPDSPTYQRWRAVELTADNHRMVLAPPGFAHGHQTLAPESEVVVTIFGALFPEKDEEHVAYDDPALDIRWPLPVAGVQQQAGNSAPDARSLAKVVLCS